VSGTDLYNKRQSRRFIWFGASIIAAVSGGALVLVTPDNCNACYAGRPICKSACDSEN